MYPYRDFIVQGYTHSASQAVDRKPCVVPQILVHSSANRLDEEVPAVHFERVLSGLNLPGSDNSSSIDISTDPHQPTEKQ